MIEGRIYDNEGELRADALTRAGNRCEFPGCGETRWLELAHLRGKQSGGSKIRNHLSNVAIFCKHHHDWLDGRTTSKRRFDNEYAARGFLAGRGAGLIW